MSGRLRAMVATFALLIIPAAAAPPLVAKGDAPPLVAWQVFCNQYPEECAVDLSEPETVAATAAVLELVEAVNRHVNDAVEPRTDQDHWGMIDRWNFPVDGLGDCEDFQLLKRKMLVDAGVPRRTLRMTVVINELGEGHAVLAVRTTTGDLFLDNRTSRVLRWNETGYKFIKRESSSAVGWEAIEPAAAVALAAAGP